MKSNDMLLLQRSFIEGPVVKRNKQYLLTYTDISNTLVASVTSTIKASYCIQTSFRISVTIMGSKCAFVHICSKNIQRTLLLKGVNLKTTIDKKWKFSISWWYNGQLLKILDFTYLVKMEEIRSQLICVIILVTKITVC